MNLTEKQKEQLIAVLQGAVFAAFAGAALLQEGKLYRKYRKKILAENARQKEKLTKQKYYLKEKDMKRKYRAKKKKKFAPIGIL